MNKTEALKKFNKLWNLGKELATIKGVQRLLEWDQETYMPLGASSARSDQIALVASLHHQKATAISFKNALADLIDLATGKILVEGLSLQEARAVELFRKDYLKEKVLPASFVKDFAKLTSQAQVVWREAKVLNNFALFAPFLDKLVKMAKKKGELWGFKNPYDALLDDYEPGFTSEKIATLFSDLRPKLALALKERLNHPKVDTTFLEGPWDGSKLMQFCHEMLQQIGFSFETGRLDLSAHPFSSAFHPTDSRITTRLTGKGIMDTISAVLHEAGHSFYETGLPLEWWGTPLGEALSYGMHESQSRLWEIWIGMSRPFWKLFYPQLQSHFPEQLSYISLDHFLKAIHQVEPSFTRVEADEVTYPLHIILRFEIEEALFSGKIKAKDVPALWNEKMMRYLGVSPPTDSLGCLQDVHWAFGGFGYFPSYTLGNLFAAEMFETLTHQFPDWSARIERGDFAFIRNWLTEQVHQKGRMTLSLPLMEAITGRTLDPSIYAAHLLGAAG